MKTNTIVAKDVQLIMNNDKLFDNSALASINNNSSVSWMKFILTDDKPNANGHRIPKEEFSNILETGLYMPVKLSEEAAEQVELDHLGSKPIGTITHLFEKDDHIEALAALWSRERPNDIELLKQKFDNGQSIEISWEVEFDPTLSKEEEDGTIALGGVNMNAATIVDFPAYMGRTPIVAVAGLEGKAKASVYNTLEKLSDGETLADAEKELMRVLVDAAKEDVESDAGSLDSIMSRVSNGETLSEKELQLLRNATYRIASSEVVSKINEILTTGVESKMETISLEEHKRVVSDLESKLEEAQEALDKRETELSETKSELEDIQPKYSELKEFKDEYDQAQAQAEKLESIREKFAEKGIEVTDNYMEEKKETFLEMSESAIDFFIQEFVAFKESQAQTEDVEEDDKGEASASISLTSQLPNISSSSDDGEVKKDDIMNYLSETLGR
jgi:hypothetical protein